MCIFAFYFWYFNYYVYVNHCKKMHSEGLQNFGKKRGIKSGEMSWSEFQNFILLIFDFFCQKRRSMWIFLNSCIFHPVKCPVWITIMVCLTTSIKLIPVSIFWKRIKFQNIPISIHSPSQFLAVNFSSSSYPSYKIDQKCVVQSPFCLFKSPVQINKISHCQPFNFIYSFIHSHCVLYLCPCQPQQQILGVFRSNAWYSVA